MEGTQSKVDFISKNTETKTVCCEMFRKCQQQNENDNPTSSNLKPYMLFSSHRCKRMLIILSSVLCKQDTSDIDRYEDADDVVFVYFLTAITLKSFQDCRRIFVT